MSKKPKILVAMLFMYVSLICVGFASWTISNNGSGSGSSSASASIIADDVINSSEIVNISDFMVFDYFKNGFVNSDGYITASGNITAKLSLNIAKCKSLFAGKENLKVVVSLSRSNLLTLVGDYFINIFKKEVNICLKNLKF